MNRKEYPRRCAFVGNSFLQNRISHAECIVLTHFQHVLGPMVLRFVEAPCRSFPPTVRCLSSTSKWSYSSFYDEGIEDNLLRTLRSTIFQSFPRCSWSGGLHSCEVDLDTSRQQQDCLRERTIGTPSCRHDEAPPSDICVSKNINQSIRHRDTCSANR